MARKSKINEKETYTMSCKALGSPDCGFSVTTHSIDEIKKATFAHANYAHPEILAKMSDEQRKMMVHKMDDLLMKK